MIDVKKCEKIYKELEKKHREKVWDESHTITYNGWTSGAREIESDLIFSYYSIGRINKEEYYYIFGKVCGSALTHSKGDFWR